MSANKGKDRRHTLTVKLQVIRLWEKGYSRKKIMETTGMPRTTVYDTIKNAKVYKAQGKKLQIKVTPTTNTSVKAKTPASSSSSKAKKVVPVLPGVKKMVFVRAKKGESSRSISNELQVSHSVVCDLMKDLFNGKDSGGGKTSTCKVVINRMNLKALQETKSKASGGDKAGQSVSRKSKAVRSAKTSGGKQQRKLGMYHPVTTRIEVVKRWESGEKKSDIAKDMGVPASTVSDMIRRISQIKAEARVLDSKKRPNGEGKERKKQNGVVKENWVKRREESEEAKTHKPKRQRPSVDSKKVKDESSVSKSKNIVVENMERLLKIWIEEQQMRGGVSDESIQRKAMSLWQFVWDRLGSDETHGLSKNFTASNAWLKQFKKMMGLSVSEGDTQQQHVGTFQTVPQQLQLQQQLLLQQQQLLLQQQHYIPSPSPPVQSFPLGNLGISRNDLVPSHYARIGVPRGVSSLLKAKIEVGGYTPRQVINLDEMVLHWKKSLANTIIDLDDTAKRDSKDQFSLLFGSNATGDLKLKPLLVYHMDNPGSLRGYIKEYLPVIWRSHPWGRVVSALCQNYVVDYMSQRCKEYASQHNIPNRFLLLVDDGPAYPPTMEDWADNIEVIFVPTLCTSVVQPMENGITSTFRRCYLHRFMLQLVRETNTEDKESLSRFWKEYTIRKALANIRMAWEDVTPYTLNIAWQNIWPECVSHGECNWTREPTVMDVVSLAHEAGFPQVTVEDVQEVLNKPEDDMSTESLIQRQLEQTDNATDEGEDDEVKTLDVSLLQHALNLFDEALNVLEDNDPNCTRSCDARNYVEQGIRNYRDLFSAKKRKAQNTTMLSVHYT